jgi:PAS domain S-box-containing protein
MSANREPSNDTDALALDRFMAEAGRVLGASLDVEATLRQIASLAVPAIADWCAIDLLQDGRLVPLAIAHQDPKRIALVERLRREYPADPASADGAYEVVRQRRAMTAVVTPEMLRDAAHDARHARLMAQLELKAWMGVPMIAGDRVLGTIAFAGAESGRTFGPTHVALAENLAARAGAALENARTFAAADRFRRILDAVAEGVFVISLENGTIVDVNKGALSLLGTAREAVVGRPLWDFVADLPRSAARRFVVPLIESRVRSRTIDVEMRSATGPSVPVEVLLQRLDLPGESPSLVAITRDIRERRDTQQRLERLAMAEHTRAAELNAVIRALGEGVFVCAPDGRITLMNPAAEALLPGLADPSYDDLREALVGGDGVPALGRHAGPVVLPLRRDPDRWVEVTTYPVSQGDHADGEASETIVVARDVTAARTRDAIRETFIGVLSHELRTPVTTIYGGSMILARSGSTLSDEVRRQIFDDIVAEAERLHRLVEDVVAMNRFAEEGSDLGHEPVLLQRVVPAATAAEMARWPGITFEMDVAHALPTVVADPIYVEQVVRNLLTNAAKYAGPAAHILVVVEPGDGEVVVRILDDGPGIDPAEGERLFELFYRSPTTSGSTSGAGIGLFVCARLVRAMGGRIWARRRDGGGSEFGFALRVMADD